MDCQQCARFVVFDYFSGQVNSDFSCHVLDCTWLLFNIIMKNKSNLLKMLSMKLPVIVVVRLRYVSQLAECILSVSLSIQLISDFVCSKFLQFYSLHHSPSNWTHRSIKRIMHTESIGCLIMITCFAVSDSITYFIDFEPVLICFAS
jgi:hypothetical protein